jgi:5-methylcytosine-specific restriction endonuclease McrA
MPSPTFTNDYAENGRELRAATRAESGHRCIRCGHPYETGLKRADKGEWSPCDEQCTHKGPIGMIVEDGVLEIISNATAGEIVKQGMKLVAKWRILTVHHFDGDKANDAWWNHLALCQRCHLTFQSRVNPEIPWLFEHSAWLKPYVGGFYARKYLGLDLTRDEVIARLDELLNLERKA